MCIRMCVYVCAFVCVCVHVLTVCGGGKGGRGWRVFSRTRVRLYARPP